MTTRPGMVCREILQRGTRPACSALMKHRGALFLFMVLALTTTGCITADVDLTECLRACDDDFELCVAAAEECFVGIEHWPGLATCVSRALDCIETQVDCITECAFEAESELS